MTVTTVLLGLFPLIVLIAIAWVSIRRGLNIGDEGYLVYGSQEVRRGRVPIKDFRAYDPARYYWCALWQKLIGSDFIAVRIAMVIFSAMSVGLSYLLVLSATQSAVLALMAAFIAQMWMFPRHKQIEHFFSLVCVAVVYALVSSTGTPLLLGLIGVGAAAFGLNILVYFIGSMTLAFTLLWVMRGAEGLVALPGFSLGLTLGLLLVIVLASFVPQFNRIYFNRKIMALLARGTTNLKVPMPWLWKAAPQQLAGFSKTKRTGLRVLFTALPVFYLAVIAAVLYHQIPSSAAQLAFAGSIVGLIYFHHVMSRADFPHIQQVMQPCILTVTAGLAATLPPVLAIAFLLMIAIASIALLGGTPEFAQTFQFRAALPSPFITERDRFDIPEPVRQKYIHQAELVAKYSTPDDTLLVAPALPGLLALFQRRTAVYDTFPVYPASPEAQAQMLSELQTSQPSIAFIGKGMVDGREELRFENNYPLVFRFLVDHYHLLEDTPSEYIFVRQPLSSDA